MTVCWTCGGTGGAINARGQYDACPRCAAEAQRAWVAAHPEERRPEDIVAAMWASGYSPHDIAIASGMDVARVRAVLGLYGARRVARAA